MAGEKEKIHTHRWPSVIWFTQPVTLTNYRYHLDGKNTFALKDSLAQKTAPPANIGFPLEAEGLHAIENAGSIEGIGYRVEFKRAFMK